MKQQIFKDKDKLQKKINVAVNLFTKKYPNAKVQITPSDKGQIVNIIIT